MKKTLDIYEYTHFTSPMCIALHINSYNMTSEKISELVSKIINKEYTEEDLQELKNAWAEELNFQEEEDILRYSQAFSMWNIRIK